MLSVFGSKTGRNQPSNSKSIFGASVWLRSLIKVPEGRALAYVDWAQQEFGIAAALSGDAAMQHSYLSGDPYLTFAKQAGAVPPGATKQTHGFERDQFKQCALGVQYGMEAKSLAARIGRSTEAAQALLDMHRKTYPRFWQWSDDIVDHARLYGSLHTVFGWRLTLPSFKGNARSLRNFPMQANGAEMLRLACCLATERRISICWPIHDAVLIEAPIEQIQIAVDIMQVAMAEASRIVLNGFVLRSETKIFTDRFADARGAGMWQIISELMARKQFESWGDWGKYRVQALNEYQLGCCNNHSPTQLL